MTKSVASPKSTGGGGFVFEDKVCAWFLAHMLDNEPPLGASLGPLERIDFQTRPDGWFLDDLLMTLMGSDGIHRCALSVKSNTQFTASGAPSDFVRTIWEQFLDIGPSSFNEASDFMGLVTAPLSIDTREALNFAVRTAKEGDPQLLPGRYSQEGWADETKRKLFESFSCPSDLAQAHGLTHSDTGRLLACLQFLQVDFESTSSESEKQAVERCRRSLRSGAVDEADKLWAHLLQISADRRPNAGYVTRLRLLDELRYLYQLAELPDHRADWVRLNHFTSVSIGQVRDSIGGLVCLLGKQDTEKLTTAFDAAAGVVLLGQSGVGKSTIAKREAERFIADGRQCLWFDSRSFERSDFAALQSDLQLSHLLPELVSAISNSGVIILDGLDRLYDRSAFHW